MIALSCGVLLLARSACAEPLPIELSWDAPAECPTHDDVMAELSRITRVKPGRVVTSIQAQASIERAADGRYKLRLRTQREDQTGETDLDASNCAALERGVTLVLALALGDGVDLIDEKNPPEAAPSPPEPPKPSPPPPPVEVAIVPPPRALERPASLRWSPWLAAAGSWGLIAKPAAGAELGLALGQEHWESAARVSLWPAGSAQPVQGIDSSFLAFVGSVSGCGRLPVEQSALAACAHLDVGIIHGSARGAASNGAATAPWYAAGPSLVLSVPIYGRMKLRIEAGLGVGFDPPHFAIRGLRDVYVVARYVPEGSLGFAF